MRTDSHRESWKDWKEPGNTEKSKNILGQIAFGQYVYIHFCNLHILEMKIYLPNQQRYLYVHPGII